MRKVSEERVKGKGERIYVDISSVNHVSFGGKQYWVMGVDEYTSYNGVILSIQRTS